MKLSFASLLSSPLRRLSLAVIVLGMSVAAGLWASGQFFRPQIAAEHTTLGVATSTNDVIDTKLTTMLPATVPLRFDAQWRDPAPLKDSNLGQALRAAATHHHPVLLDIAYAPAEAAVDDSEGCNEQTICGAKPNAADQYAEYAANVARLCQELQASCTYELWNEQNMARYWFPRADPAGYATLVKAAYPAIKKIDPEAIVLLGGLSPSATEPENGNYAPADYMAELYDHGIKDSFDAIATHPYDNLDQTKQIHEIMVRHGDGGKQIWATEVGAKDGQVQYTAATTVDRFNELLEEWRSLSWTGPFFWYSWHDSDGTHGLVDDDDRPYPLYEVFLQAAKR
jgi:hypothetical protein